MGDNFNENLKEARLKSGISQKDLAENIGVAKSTYSLYESGKREPNVDTIKKIASSLNVSADTLLGIDNEPTTLAAHFVFPLRRLPAGRRKLSFQIMER